MIDGNPLFLYKNCDKRLYQSSMNNKKLLFNVITGTGNKTCILYIFEKWGSVWPESASVGAAIYLCQTQLQSSKHFYL